MGPVTYFIAILGCADGGASCQTVATTAARFDNQAQCVAARDSALDANTDLDFPMLLAECRPASRKASGAVPSPDARDATAA
jgi:hypothetical protein